MERLLAKISIRKKLTIVIMLSSMLVLLLVAGAFTAVEIYSSRNHLIIETRTLADSLGANLQQPLLLKDTSTVNQILASLQVQPRVRASYLFNSAGDPVAGYLDQSDSRFLLNVIPRDFSTANRPFWTNSSEIRIICSWSHLSLFLPMLHDGERIGTLYLLSDLNDLYGRVSGVAFGVLLTMLLMFGFSWYLAGKLQRPVSRPLMNLVQTMETVTLEKDYQLRAEKETDDEIGELVDGFNRMLARVELHRDQLEKHQENLELTVAQRTEELRGMLLALDQTKRQLETVGQAKSQFIANITHELRTPLIGVLGMNELLFRTPLNDEQQGLAGMVAKSGADLLLLINNILDFSRMEAGKLKIEPVEFEIHRVIESVLEMLAGQAEEKGLLLVSEISPEAAWQVRGDELRLKQILTNLVGNAIKFTERGEVKVSLAWRRKKASFGEFEIRVTDTGIGMDSTAQQHIFSAFYQADNTSTRDFAGSGLGLAIVRQLVDLMSGKITLSSAPGVGSCFQVTLCLPLENQIVFSLPEDFFLQKILFCSAGYPLYENLASRLQSLGIAVQNVSTEAEAWYQLGTAVRFGNSFDLLLCSPLACLPGGQPLYLAVREDPKFRNLRQILLPLSRFSVLPLERQESILRPPLDWSGLMTTLLGSWQSLRLVEPAVEIPEKRAFAETLMDQPPKRLLVAGGGVASRELVKLALQDSSYLVESAPDLLGLLARPAQNFIAVLLDLPFLPDDQIKNYLAQTENCANSLVFYDHEDQIKVYQKLVDVWLKKPFGRKQLQNALDLLLANKNSAPTKKLESSR